MRRDLRESWLLRIIVPQLCVIGMQACDRPGSAGLHLDPSPLARCILSRNTRLGIDYVKMRQLE